MGKTFRVVSVFVSVFMVAAAAVMYFRPAQVQAGGGVVAYVISDKILDNYSAATTVNAQLAALRQESEADLEKQVQDRFGPGDVSALPRESQLEIRKMIEQAEETFQKQSEALRDKQWVPIVDAVNNAIAAVAAAEKFEVVLEQSAVIYGGVDITDKVISKLKE